MPTMQLCRAPYLLGVHQAPTTTSASFNPHILMMVLQGKKYKRLSVRCQRPSTCLEHATDTHVSTHHPKCGTKGQTTDESCIHHF